MSYEKVDISKKKFSLENAVVNGASLVIMATASAGLMAETVKFIDSGKPAVSVVSSQEAQKDDTSGMLGATEFLALLAASSVISRRKDENGKTAHSLNNAMKNVQEISPAIQQALIDKGYSH